MNKVFHIISCNLLAFTIVSIGCSIVESKNTAAGSEAETAIGGASQPDDAPVSEWQKKHKVPAEVVQVATEGFLSDVRDLPDEHIPKEWVVTSESLRSSSLGEPFQQYKIKSDALRDYHKGDTVESLLTETNIWYFPILVNNKIALTLWVKQNAEGAGWLVAGWGRGLLETELNRIMNQWPASTGYNPVFVTCGNSPGAHYGWFFYVPEKNQYNLTEIVLKSGKKYDTSYSNLDTIDNIVKWLLSEMGKERHL